MGINVGILDIVGRIFKIFIGVEYIFRVWVVVVCVLDVGSVYGVDVVVEVFVVLYYSY